VADPCIVIVGAGLAGLRAAQAARQAGHVGELVVIGAERHRPYTRPPLSKELLRGESTADQTAFPGVDALEAHWRLGVAATGLDADGHTLSLADGEMLAYDRLIVASGARARPLPGAAAGHHLLRDLDDAQRLEAALGAGGHLAIIGAGFVGCEVAASARARGVAVTLIDVAPQPLTPIGPELGERIAQLHRDHAVDLRLGVGAHAVGGDGVRLADGTGVSADAVLVALGAVPNTEFLRGSGVELDATGGVVCDATLTSVSQPDVLAAGDVVSWPHPGASGERVRVEHWTTAAEHGRLAGANATRPAAGRQVHVAPPYFWSDQYDVKIQCVGFPARAARIEIVEQDAETGRLLAEAHDADGELIGAVAFNNARRLAEYRGRLVAEHA
jgi:NADPH-dependent 2,4-dienoyl-CoA reductase/sulfur reductase-like enzyme